MVKKMAERIGNNSSDIVEKDYNFFDIFEPHSDAQYRQGVNLPAYSVQSDLIDYETLEKMNAENFLDGWVRHYGADGIEGYSMEYSYENIICAADAVLKNYNEQYEKIFYGDSEQDVSAEETEKVLASRRYEYTFSCVDKPDTLVGVIDLQFGAFGGDNTGTWQAYIDKDFVSLRFSEIEWQQWFSIHTAEKTQNGYKLQAWKNIFTDNEKWEIIFDIQKNTCQIHENGEKFPFSIHFELEGKKYAGCAYEMNHFFTMGRFGKISSFLAKTSIEYHGSVPTDGKYEIFRTNDLVQIDFQDSKNPENQHYIILRDGAYDDTIYWNGNGNIDDETCEKFADDEDLMGFGMFYTCNIYYD